MTPPSALRSFRPQSLAWLAAGVLLLVRLACPTQARADDHDAWFVIELDGSRAGWMRLRQQTSDDHIATESETSLTLRRFDQPMEIRVQSRMVERHDGRPVQAESFLQVGGPAVRTEYHFRDGHVLVRTGQGARLTETTQPWPEGSWLTPAAAGQAFAQAVREQRTECSLLVLDPALAGLTPVHFTYRDLQPASVEAMGKILPAIRATVTTSLLPSLEMVEYLDADGVPIVSHMDVGFARFVVRRSERQVALAALDPPEIMAQTLVVPDRPIAAPRTRRRGVFRLTADPGAHLSALETGAQTVQRLGPDSLRIEVDLDLTTPARAQEANDPALRAGSAMIATDDPTIRRLVAEALAGAGPAAEQRAEALRRFVYDFVEEKSLAIGFASASEVARVREGDCTEHGTLLAAMLRTAGIPARVVSGLVYVEGLAGQGAFGYHLWTQALVERDGRPVWLDLDATLPPDTPFDATHIALTSSTLAGDEVVNALVELAPVLHRLRVEVETIE